MKNILDALISRITLKMKRIEDVYIKKRIIIGSESELTPTNDLETHKWKFYIRSTDSQNNSSLNYISKIVVTLHDTFPVPVRTLINPFVIEERGWGEFTVYAKIYFDDLNEKHVGVSHHLKLFGEEINGKVISERIETLVFKSPSKKLYDLLIKGECFEESTSNDSEGRKIDSAIEYIMEKYDEL